MPSARTTVDGLWRCLCPSIDAALLARAISAPRRPRLADNRRHGHAKRACDSPPRATTIRPLHTTQRRLQDPDGDPFAALADAEAARRDTKAEEDRGRAAKQGNWKVNLEVKPKQDGHAEEGAQQVHVPVNASSVVVSEEQINVTDGPQDEPTEPVPIRKLPEEPKEIKDIQDDPATNGVSDEAAQAAQTASPSPEGLVRSVLIDSPKRTRRYKLPFYVRRDIVEGILDSKPPDYTFPDGTTNTDVLDALRYARMLGQPKWRRLVAHLVKHLLKHNGPDAFIYETLLMAHTLPEGSADKVRMLLEEMRTKQIPWSQTAYHAALRALAVHPDYLLRNDIIREMEERWVEILPKGHRYIALGLLRDEQYELALEKLDEMIRNGWGVDPWVFEIFIYVFGKLEFLDDAVRIARHMVDRGLEVSVNVWQFLLDMGSKGQNHEATSYIWNRAVKQELVNPSDGTALNILNMCAAYGDTELATQVIQYLAARGTRLGRPHYEALADAYSVQGKVGRAIEVYCIMAEAGADVTHSSAGSFCQAFTRDPSLLDKAVQAMSELKQKYELPIGIFNAVLNEMARANTHPDDDAGYEQALALYRRVREFVLAGPNLETFKNMLWRCSRPDVAQFLVGEMVAFNIGQTLVIRELLFRVHVEHDGPTHRAKGYFFKIAPHLQAKYKPKSWKWENIMDLTVKLVRRLIKERDPEAWRILDICKENGLEEERIRGLREDVENGTIVVADGKDNPETVEEWATKEA